MMTFVARGNGLRQLLPPHCPPPLPPLSRRVENRAGRLKRELKFVSCEIKGFASVVKHADLLLKSLRRELTVVRARAGAPPT